MAQIATLSLFVLLFIPQYVSGFSPYTIKDYTLHSQSYLKKITADWFECVVACSQDSNCLSYNYHYEKQSNGLCELYECGMDQCLSSRKTLVFSKGHLYQQIKPSKNGVECPKDECSSSPCLNGGTCKDQVNGFSCTCVAGYNGPTCEINIDDCANTPCQNGGTCTDKVNGFSCNCQKGYSGVRCQIKHVGTCASNPCLNGGTCHYNNDVFWCDCLTNHFGYVCESPRVESEKQDQ